MKKPHLLKPTKSWKNPITHAVSAVNSEWYKLITELQSEFVHSTVNFCSKRDMIFMLLPVTTGSVSSPMGLGSDSKPVKVNILDQETYLVDSMQFYLEYSCRLHQGKGHGWTIQFFRYVQYDFLSMQYLFSMITRSL